MVCVVKAASACSHMTWRTASRPPSANTIRRATAPMEHGAGKESAAIGCTACGEWVLMRGKFKFKVM
jgi:hypothetical protein